MKISIADIYTYIDGLLFICCSMVLKARELFELILHLKWNHLYSNALRTPFIISGQHIYSKIIEWSKIFPKKFLGQ